MKRHTWIVLLASLLCAEIGFINPMGGTFWQKILLQSGIALFLVWLGLLLIPKFINSKQ